MLRWIEYLDTKGKINTIFTKPEFQEQIVANCRPVQVKLRFPVYGTKEEIKQFIEQLTEVRDNIALELRNQVEISVLLAILHKSIGDKKEGLEELENALDYLNILIQTKRRSLNRLSNMQDLAPNGVTEFEERISALITERKVLENKINGINHTITRWKNAG